MATEREQYLLERCLRLEATIAQSQGLRVAPPAPDPRVHAPRPPFVPLPRPVYRNVRADDIATMRALRARGSTVFQISMRLGWSAWTVRHYTRDVFQEREVGG